MTRNEARLNLPSLSRHFEAPTGLVGHFGWVVGYSADEDFLNAAAERFTTYTADQRANHARVALALMLDPGVPGLDWVGIPGVARLHLKDVRTKPFRLLHAKVAILGFRHAQRRDAWHLRLVVSTGNWTRQTLEDSLDLGWRIDVASDDLSEPTSKCRRDCADLAAAADLLAFLRRLFDTRLMHASATGPADVAWLDDCLLVCAGLADGTARFFDNRRQSLLAQLHGLVTAATGEREHRNYLAMGSGFYEAPGGSTAPEVPDQIVSALKDAGLLTASADVDLFVNRLACQAVAHSVKALKRRGITVRPATAPSEVYGELSARTLHAKFLFSANFRQNSNRCGGAWVYLGSGNLTGPGFTASMSPHTGNLETGVVFAPGPLQWSQVEGSSPNDVVTSLLPVQWSESVTGDAQLQEGAPYDHPSVLHEAPPVAWFAWHENATGSWLQIPAGDVVHQREAALHLLLPDGSTLDAVDGGFPWYGERPRVVRCRWNAAYGKDEADIPVIDEFGRIAAAPLRSVDVDEAWWLLAEFPLPPEEDIKGTDDDGRGDPMMTGTNSVAGSTPSSYPIRRMMELVENIAEKQTGIARQDWNLWCRRLEQTLIRAKDSAPVAYFRAQRVEPLNPLSPLRHESFRPDYAETPGTQDGALYEETLRRVEEAWGVAHMLPMVDR